MVNIRQIICYEKCYMFRWNCCKNLRNLEFEGLFVLINFLKLFYDDF